MAGSKTTTGFGLRKVELALRPTAPNATPTWVAIPSVESAAFKLNVEETEQWGDDKHQGTFYHSQKGTITVKGNKLSMRVLELLSGNTVTSAAGGKEKILFGTDKELIPARVMVRGVTPTRNEDGTVGEMVTYWYNCDVKTVWDGIPGSERAKLAEANLMFNSYASETDDEGDPIVGAEWAFGHTTF